MTKYRQQATSDVWGIINLNWKDKNDDDNMELSIELENAECDITVNIENHGGLGSFSPAGLRTLLYSVQINAGNNLEVFELYTR